MDMGRYLVEAHLKEGRTVAELAATHGIHRSWIYKLLARHRVGGSAALAPRSRRPHHCPAATATDVEERVVAVRKQLTDQGLDAGAATIHWHLTRAGQPAPSVSTIWRILTRRGFVTPQPRKRPKSSYTRFQADLPNECWQSDMTHWTLAGDTGVEIVNFLDDHSRLALASIALPVTKATDIAAIFTATRTRYGTPAAMLTDNGCIYTAKHRGGRVVLETELNRLGVTHKHSRPYHPQTCGKVERFHQTMKKWLTKQPPAATIAELQAQLDTFITYYNTQRPHRALGRRTPQETYDTKIKAHPSTSAPASHYRVRTDKIDSCGKVTLRHNSQLRHIGVGRAHAGTPVQLLIADQDVRIINATTGELIRHLTIDPSRNYQPRTNSNVYDDPRHQSPMT